MSPAAPYLHENLQLDYNHLESRQCFCQSVKQIGELMCTRCLAAINADDRKVLVTMKPGEGVASAAAIAHTQMWRSKKGWRS